MPRPPAKRGRAARQKPASQPPVKERKNEFGPGDGVAPSESVLGEHSKDDVSMSGALGWKEPTKTRKTSSVSKATNTSSFEGLGTRKTETPKTNRAAYEGGSSRLPASASRPATRGQPFASGTRRGDASSKIQKIATPGFDSSMLSNFRPRPRQPSILQLMDDDGSSDLDSEAFLGSFDPDDESTPLKLSRRKTSLPLDELPPSPSPKKTVQPPQSAKKRKLIAVEIPVLPALDNKSYPPVASDRAPTPEQDEAVGVTSDDDSIPLPEPPGQRLSPEVASQTMALPASSSVAGSPAKEAPSRATSTKHAQISTATLRENLLAARRRRRRRGGVDVFDMPSDNDSDARGDTDDDELSRLPSKKTTRNSARNPLKPNKRGVNKKIDRSARTKRQPSTKRRREAQYAEKPSVVIVSTAAKKQLSRPSTDHITYSRRREQDKENQLYDAQSSPSDSDRDPDDATPTASAGGQRLVSAELAKQAKKFAEVDRWTMEFEDVTGEQSSPFR